MTDEEKAEEYLKKNKICNNENWEVGGKYCYTLCKQSYLDGLAEGRKENEELKNQIEQLQQAYTITVDKSVIREQELETQIEKMKRCFNCSKWFSNTEFCVSNERGASICDKWEPAE